MSITDEPTATAITAVWHDDENTAERWFSLISSTYHAAVAENDGNPPDFDRFWSAFDNAASSAHGANVEAFRGYLANVNDPMAVIADLAGDAPDAVLAEVLGLYRAGLAAAYAGQGELPAEAAVGDGDGDGEPYDESYWAAYLERWAGAWNGADDTWTEFAEGFTYWAGEEPKFATELREQANALVGHAGTLDLPARVGYLADFGLVAVDQQTVTEVGEPSGETPGETPVEAAQQVTEEAELVEQFADSPVVAEAVDNLLEQDVAPILAVALQDVPEAAELTPEEINEVLERVLAKQLSSQLAETA
ncbi:hypothetical protein [Labedaea rhizosphaerae]|uniref:Uncharacterized protein n=1 Tax=Labedaea rhizosphaerae TaxID=598644 RepID=A0A4R6SJL3_LABRH|nr:hypothetical protein [Labedaea rhizosphaerae]TDQ04516.1 hypothetical protein EV186_101468 [Labedaea rhizosphaerae]